MYVITVNKITYNSVQLLTFAVFIMSSCSIVFVLFN